MLLENERKEDPWELITEPSLLNKPVKPKKSLSPFSGLILGLLISGIISIIIEKNKDLIYETDEFERFFDANLILDLAKCSNKNYLETYLSY